MKTIKSLNQPDMNNLVVFLNHLGLVEVESFRIVLHAYMQECFNEPISDVIYDENYGNIMMILDNGVIIESAFGNPARYRLDWMETEGDDPIYQTYQDVLNVM